MVPIADLGIFLESQRTEWEWEGLFLLHPERSLSKNVTARPEALVGDRSEAGKPVWLVGESRHVGLANPGISFPCIYRVLELDSTFAFSLVISVLSWFTFPFHRPLHGGAEGWCWMEKTGIKNADFLNFKLEKSLPILTSFHLLFYPNFIFSTAYWKKNILSLAHVLLGFWMFLSSAGGGLSFNL